MHGLVIQAKLVLLITSISAPSVDRRARVRVRVNLKVRVRVRGMPMVTKEMFTMVHHGLS